ncbi:hypothetical protein HF086_014983 [Spodoptera exigua]|uniref:Uncharacterized protein n=1 Tax=Spodoptera exigua TaxID=7107 RepID=A0A922ML86_SPOEX|nr:hypothetical protein HF086_014983 [Spodoptera exigua]
MLWFRIPFGLFAQNLQFISKQTNDAYQQWELSRLRFSLICDDKNPFRAIGFHIEASRADLTSNPGFQSSLSIASKNVDEKPYNPFEHRTVEHPNS